MEWPEDRDPMIDSSRQSADVLTFYNFAQRIDWCAEGGQVVDVPFRQHMFTDASTYAQFRGLTEDSVTPFPAPEVTSVKKATVENCVPIEGCLSVTYPFVTITVRADGTSTFTEGE